MKYPNKVVSYRNSVLSKFPIVLKELETQDYSVLDLYKKLERKLDGLSEYMDVLECLFFLGTIELLPGGVILHYVKGNSVQ